MEEEEAEAPDPDMEQEQEWEQQAGWGRAARERKQVLEDGQEDAPEEVRAEQAGESGKAQAQKDKAATESYEKRQMLWKGMAGRSWTELVQQWGVPQVEALQLQKSIASLMREIGPRLGLWVTCIGRSRQGSVGEGEQGDTRGGDGHAGGS